jgi:hypothetical protein
MSVMVRGMSVQRLVAVMQQDGVAIKYDEVGSEYCAEDVDSGRNGPIVYGIYDQPEEEDNHYYDDCIPF